MEIFEKIDFLYILLLLSKFRQILLANECTSY